MQETKFKIDDDLVEYLNAKQDAEKLSMTLFVT